MPIPLCCGATVYLLEFAHRQTTTRASGVFRPDGKRKTAAKKSLSVLPDKLFIRLHFLVACRCRPCILQKRTRKNSRNAGHEIRLGGREYKLSSISVPAHFPSHTISTIKKKTAKLTLWPLVAATFFMVSGGTYGTEEII